MAKDRKTNEEQINTQIKKTQTYKRKKIHEPFLH